MIYPANQFWRGPQKPTQPQQNQNPWQNFPPLNQPSPQQNIYQNPKHLGFQFGQGRYPGEQQAFPNQPPNNPAQTSWNGNVQTGLPQVQTPAPPIPTMANNMPATPWWWQNQMPQMNQPGQIYQPQFMPGFRSPQPGQEEDIFGRLQQNQQRNRPSIPWLPYPQINW
jgi:hypothetical protein